MNRQKYKPTYLVYRVIFEFAIVVKCKASPDLL